MDAGPLNSLITGANLLSPEYFLTNFPNVTRIVFSAALGLLLGTEREWSEKPAGMRTFTIITTLATVMVIVEEPWLLLLGGVLVVIQGTVFAVRGLLYEADTYLLTTSIAMVLAYGIGVLIGKGFFIEGVIVAVLTTFLLVLRRELHGFARNLSHEEIRSAIEFTVLAFVVYPLLPNEKLGPWNAINPRTLWLLVVAVSALGFANYLIVQRYGTRGIAITSFFGGLVNSTAVIGELITRTRHSDRLSEVAVGVVLLANAAMAFRDMLIALTFVPDLAYSVGPPLLAITVTGVGLSYLVTDWEGAFDLEFDSPYNLRTALKFGALFLVVLLVSAGAQAVFGTSGFLVSSFLGGLISSGAVTTSVVLLVQSGQIGQVVAAAGIIAAVSASILVKLGLVISMDRSLTVPVSIATSVLIGIGVVAAVVARVLPV